MLLRNSAIVDRPFYNLLLCRFIYGANLNFKIVKLYILNLIKEVLVTLNLPIPDDAGLVEQLRAIGLKAGK